MNNKEHWQKNSAIESNSNIMIFNVKNCTTGHNTRCCISKTIMN